MPKSIQQSLFYVGAYSHRTPVLKYWYKKQLFGLNLRLHNGQNPSLSWNLWPFHINHRKRENVMAEFDLVFEGGGAKGIGFVGALNALLAGGHSYRRLIGTSAGAITASLLAAQYSPEEMLACICERTAGDKPVFSTFMDKPVASDFSEDTLNNSVTMRALQNVPFPPKGFILKALLKSSIYTRLFAFTETGGFYSGRTFVKWLEARLVQKAYSSDITLQQLHEETGYDLSLVATNVTFREMLVLNHRTTPNLPVAYAVRMSMSIPFIWEEVAWQAHWGEYLPWQGRDKTIAGSKIVDGGVLSNFPIDLIAESGRAVIEAMGDLDARFAKAADNLGLLIDESLSVLEQPASGTGRSKLIDDLPSIKRIHNLAETMMAARDNSLIDYYAAEICRLPAKGYGTLEFDMEGARRDDLIEAGRQAMNAHLSKRGYSIA